MEFLSLLRLVWSLERHLDSGDYPQPGNFPARLETMEGWINLEVSTTSLGKFKFKGTCNDNPGIGTELNFSFASDPSFFPDTLAKLDRYIAC